MIENELDRPTIRRNQILQAAIQVFGRLGYQKTSVEDIAEAARISKQGLYLHFKGKQEIFLAAIKHHLDEGVLLVDEALKRNDVSLYERLLDALDAWFGRHIETFAPTSFDIIEIGRTSNSVERQEYMLLFQAKIAKAIASSSDFKAKENVCSPKEIAEVLFRFGLTWKEERTTRTEFKKKLALAVRACCQLKKGN